MVRWLAVVLLEWSAIAATAVVVHLAPHPFNFVLLPFAIVVIGRGQHALLVMGHDAVHRSGWTNDVLADLLTFAPFGVSLARFRVFHLAHHAHLGGAGDPEVEGFKNFARLGIRWPMPFDRRWFVLEVVLSLIGFRSYAAVVHVLSFAPRSVGGAARVVFVALMAVLVDPWFIGLWALSMVTVLWTLLWFRIWVEHLGADGGTHRLAPSLWQRVLLLPHNIGAHYEHHARPKVPSWALMGLRKALDGPSPIGLGELFRSYEVQR